MIVYLVSGIWHGANWTFIIWGILHGIANCLNRIFKQYWDKMHDVIQWILTFIFINTTWVFFRADSVEHAIEMLKRLTTGSMMVTPQFINQITIPEYKFIRTIPGISTLFTEYPIIIAFLLVAVGLIGVIKFSNCNNIRFKYTWKNALLTVVLLVWTIFSFSGVSTFLYFNF